MLYPKPNYKRATPKRKERGAITKEQYQLALDWFGETCNICGSYPIELHHLVYKSQQGRGGWRNLMPLCKSHHEMAHTDRNFADGLRDMRAETHGKLYYTDRFDLYDAGLITVPTEQAFEQYQNEMGKFR